MVYTANRTLTQENEHNLKALLSTLYTEEGKAVVIDALVGTKTVPQEYIGRTILFYENTHDYSAAKKLATKAGMHQQAANLEQRIRNQRRAADNVALIDASFPTTEECTAAKKIIKRYEQFAGNASVELTIEVIGAYHTLDYSDEAVRVALEYGLFQQAIEIREQDENWYDAAALAEQHNLYGRAGINYEKAKDHGKAGDCFFAEVEARKEKRKNSKDIFVKAVSYILNIYTPVEEKLLLRAAGNYLTANWTESSEKVFAKITDKKKMYMLLEKQRDFKGAETYACFQGDSARQQFYKTIDILVHPERGVQEKEQLKEQKKDNERVEKIRDIRKKMIGNLTPFKLVVSADLIPGTVELYEACRDAAEIAIEKYAIQKYSNPIFDKRSFHDCSLLEEKFVETGLLAAEYYETMRTMATISSLISRKRIRSITCNTYALYYQQALDFVDAMEVLVTGKPIHRDAAISKQSPHYHHNQSLQQSVHRATSQTEKGLLEQGYELATWSCKELAKIALVEGGYFYAMKYAVLPVVIGLGIVGECAYLDYLIHSTADPVSESSAANRQKTKMMLPVNASERTCQPKLQATTLAVAK